MTRQYLYFRTFVQKFNSQFLQITAGIFYRTGFRLYILLDGECGMDKQFAIAALLVASVAFFIKSEVVSDKLDDAKRQIEDAEIQLTELEKAKIRVEELEDELYGIDEKVRDESNWSFNEGYDDGYDDGYRDGKENGYDEGFEAGKWDEYYEEMESWKDCASDTYNEGFTDCLDTVKDSGYNEAYKQFWGVYPWEQTSSTN